MYKNVNSLIAKTKNENNCDVSIETQGLLYWKKYLRVKSKSAYSFVCISSFLQHSLYNLVFRKGLHVVHI